MAIPVFGTLVLTSLAGSGSVTFDTDPPEYAAHEGPKRMSRRRTLGGTTIMDFGTFAADGDVKCEWRENALNKATVQTLLMFKRLEQHLFRLEDSEGNSYVVVIADFKPKHKYGYPGLFVGAMTFWIVSIEDELGSPYMGL